MSTDIVARALAIKANKTLPAISSADAGKLATVDSNGKWVAADLEVGHGEVAVDSTLLVSGAAADAKVTGDKVAELKSAIVSNTLNFGMFGTFSLGGLNTDGSLLPSQTTRVSSTSHQQFDRNLTVRVKSGFRFGYIPFTNESVGAWSGWFSTDTPIPKGMEFVLQISKSPEGSQTANVHEYVSALTFDDESVEKYAQTEANKNDIATIKPLTITENSFSRINLNQYTTYAFNLESSNWQAAWAYRCKIIERSEFDNAIKFDAFSTNRITFAFLKSNNAADGVAPEICDGTSKITISPGNKRVFPVPNDCNYVYIYISTWTDDVITSTLGVYNANLNISKPDQNNNNPIVDELGLVNKTWDMDYGLQGGCTDGENLYVIFVANEGNSYYCNKYNILSGDKTSVTVSSDLGHANDIAYNPNTGYLYVACMDSSKIAVMNTNFEIIETLTVKGENDDAKDWYRIAYDRKNNKFYLCDDPYTVYVYSSAFVYEKTVLLNTQQIALTPQGMETDGIYYYMLHIGGVFVFDLNGAFVKFVSLDTTVYYEPEAICYDWNDNFYLSSAGYYSYMMIKKFATLPQTVQYLKFVGEL